MAEVKEVFTGLPAQSKVWVYQSRRFFTGDEISIIKSKLDNFVSVWESHGRKLTGAYDILHDRFIVICVDETGADASGCSIDKSVQVIKELEGLLKTDLLDKSEIAYRNRGSIETVAFNKVKQAINEGKITPHTTVYNNTVNILSDFQSSWETEAGKSWMSRFFNNP